MWDKKMRKIVLLLYAILLINGCNNGSISKQSDSKIKQADIEVGIKNSFLTDELLDISKEEDYEKYFPKRYLNAYSENTVKDNMFFKSLYDGVESYERYEIDINDNEIFAYVYDFIKNKNTLDEAYKLIAYLFENRDNLNYIDFNRYCLPEGYYAEKYLDKIRQCYNYYENGAKQYRITFLALLKARNIIKTSINSLTDDNKKSKAYLMTAISYFNQDRLYQLGNIKKYAALWKELGGRNVEIFNEEDNKQLTALLTYLAYNDNIDVKEILQNGVDKEFIYLVLSKNGIFNYLNDDYYMPVGISEIYGLDNKIYFINAFFPQYEFVADTNILMQALIEPDKDFLPSEYGIQNSFSIYNSNIYPIYILALNGAVYTVVMKDNKPLQVDFRNPAYFDTNFITADKNYGNLPEILNENNYKYKQINYLFYQDGKAELRWNGNIRNQQPDIAKLLKFRGTINCIQAVKDNNTKLIEYCGNREKLIKAKYLHNQKCKKNEKDCFISAEEIDSTFFTGDI